VAATRTILVVDDEPDVVSFLETTLKGEDFTVLAAYDGISALDITKYANTSRQTRRPTISRLSVSPQPTRLRPWCGAGKLAQTACLPNRFRPPN